MAADSIDVEARPVEDGDDPRGLSLGHADFQPLKTFVERDAQDYSRRMLAKPCGVFDGKKLLAYVSLLCSQIEVVLLPSPLDSDGAEYRHDEYPALKIARLAVDGRHRGKGLGRLLVQHGLGIARNNTASMVGCRFVILDAKKQSIEFYKKHGFNRIESGSEPEQPIMYLDLMGTGA